MLSMVLGQIFYVLGVSIHWIKAYYISSKISAQHPSSILNTIQVEDFPNS